MIIVRPIAIKMFNIKGKDSDKYFGVVERKPIEETDYRLEPLQANEISEAWSSIPNFIFQRIMLYCI